MIPIVEQQIILDQVELPLQQQADTQIGAGAVLQAGNLAKVVPMLLQDYLDNVLPDNFSDLLYLASSSSEIYSLFAPTIPYFCNLLLINDYFQNRDSRKGQRLLASKIEAQELAQMIKQISTAELIRELPKSFGFESTRSVLLFCNFMVQVAQKEPFKFELPDGVGLPFQPVSYKCCQVDFLHSQMLRYEDQFPVVLRHMCERREICSRFQETADAFLAQIEMSTEVQKPKLTQSFLAGCLGQIGIRADAKQTVSIRTLARYMLGHDVTDCFGICIPEQLVLALARCAEGMLLPESYTPFYVNGQLFFQVHFPELCETVSLAEYPVSSAVMVEFHGRLCAFSDGYQDDMTFRLYRLPYLSARSAFISRSAPSQISIPAVPTCYFPVSPARFFLSSNLRLEYFLCYVLMDAFSEALVLQGMRAQAESFLKLTEHHAENGRPRVMQGRESHLFYVLAKEQIATVYLYASVTKHNQIDSNILAVYTALQSGLLRLQHPALRRFLQQTLIFNDFVHYDRLTIWSVLIQHLQVYQEQQRSPKALRPQNNTDCRDYVCAQMPLLRCFMEPEQLHSQIHVRNSSAVAAQITRDTARDSLCGLIHELQHMQPTKYLSTLNPEDPLLPQVLADVTSISPLYSTVKFAYRGQQGVDSGGLWRQTLSVVFDELIGDMELSSGMLQKLCGEKLGKRRVEYTELNKENPNRPSMLLQQSDQEKTRLIPHYNTYTSVTSSTVFPRLTEKRSCLYYFGRLASFCLVYSFKLPDFLHRHFWEAAVGGRLYFTEALAKEYAQQLQTDKMFAVNGTQPISSLYFQLSDAEIQRQYRGQWDVFQSALHSPGTDFLENLGVPQCVVTELNAQGLKTHTPEQLRQTVAVLLEDLRSGKALAKAYAEFRLGFRHPFSTSMVSVGQSKVLAEFALQIDTAFSFLGANELVELITYSAELEDHLPRHRLVQQLFGRNYQRIQIEAENTAQAEVALEGLVAVFSHEGMMSQKQIRDFIFACSGQRSLTGTEINVKFVSYDSAEKRLLQFHTCFNAIDLPVAYFNSLALDEAADFIKLCVQLALSNGFGIA